MKQLKLLLMTCVLCAGSSAWAQVADGDYYLFDAATKSYLSRGADYGTRAVTNGFTGLPVTWNSSNGTITFKDSNQRLFDASNGNVYTDNTKNSTGWTLEAKDDGYTIRYGADGNYLGYSDGTKIIVFVDSEEKAIVWKFLSSEEYTNTIQENTKSSYQRIIAAAGFTFSADQFLEQVGKTFINKDMTDKVPTARFAGDKGTWTWNQVRIWSGGAVNYGTDYAEFFQVTGSFHQTITVPSGLYRVSINGFERAASNDICTSLGVAGYEPVTATFEANGYGIGLASWYSGQTGGNNPNSTGEAVTKFNNGKYQNEIYTYVGEDEQLTLTVNVPSIVGAHWVLVNNVVVTQLTELTAAGVRAL